MRIDSNSKIIIKIDHYIYGDIIIPVNINLLYNLSINKKTSVFTIYILLYNNISNICEWVKINNISKLNNSIKNANAYIYKNGSTLCIVSSNKKLEQINIDLLCSIVNNTKQKNDTYMYKILIFILLFKSINKFYILNNDNSIFIEYKYSSISELFRKASEAFMHNKNISIRINERFILINDIYNAYIDGISDNDMVTFIFNSLMFLNFTNKKYDEDLFIGYNEYDLKDILSKTKIKLSNFSREEISIDINNSRCYSALLYGKFGIFRIKNVK